MVNVNVLLLGANGQLGRCLQDVLPAGSFFPVARTGLDMSEPSLVIGRLNLFFKQCKFTHVINCAAYTNVEKAEHEISEAFSVNCHSVREVARWCRDNHVKLIHISTDYASEQPAPANIYGQSKLAGEQAVEGTRDLAYTIIRTSALFSEYATTSFLRKVLDKIKAGETMKMKTVACQPTYAKDLALFILNELKYIDPTSLNARQRFNFCNKEAERFDIFAYEIGEYIGIPVNMVPDYTTDLIRPVLAKLDVDIDVPDWRRSLYYCIQRMKDLELL